MSKPIYPIDAFEIHRLLRQGGSAALDCKKRRMIEMLSQGYVIQPMDYPEGKGPIPICGPLLTEKTIEEWLGKLDMIWNNPVPEELFSQSPSDDQPPPQPESNKSENPK